MPKSRNRKNHKIKARKRAETKELNKEAFLKAIKKAQERRNAQQT